MMKKRSRREAVFAAAAAAAVLISAVPARGAEADGSTAFTDSARRAEIEEALNLANILPEWTYSEEDDAWTMEAVTAVTFPELPDYQGVSVCVPGAYVEGLDTDGDGRADATEGTASGTLVIDREAEVTSAAGQVYRADTAPVIVNTGAAGYSAQANQTASAAYAAQGYINVACGNRGKQSTLEDGTFTGDAPCCLVDQKNAVRFVKYNILLGNLPGSVDYFVSTGGSGGGAHAVMLAATSDHPDFYDYEIAQGAVGIYKNEDGSCSACVSADGEEIPLSDGMWGCMAYSAITSLAEADMALAFEYTLDPSYSFNTPFQKETAALLAAEYMDYINGRDLSVEEQAVGFDVNGDGDTEDTIALTIEYDAAGHSDTNGYFGTYVDLYLAEFAQSLGDYIERLACTEDWTWFDAEGNALSDSEVAAMTDGDRAEAFLAGTYAKGSTGADSGRGMGMGGGPMGGFPGGDGEGRHGGFPGGDSAGGPPDRDGARDGAQTEEAGTPDAGTTQSAQSTTDSANYASFEEMVEAYEADLAEIEAGDAYGNNIVDLYNPIRYIGAGETADPAWARVLMGAAEGDISMFNSLNLQVAWLNAGTEAQIEWQWDGGHVPSEIFGDSLALYVDTMYGRYAEGAVEVQKEEAEGQKENGTAEEPSGADLTDWVRYDEEKGITMTLSGAAGYRTAAASKAIPGFDVMDYGQEDYEFGSSTADARHWSEVVCRVFRENGDTLSPLFNAE